MTSDKLKNILSNEHDRQKNSLELVASENYVSKNVMNACANVFTNKYSEWYPGARYYGWQEFVDQLEIYTQELALQVFWLQSDKRWVNVQPLSGSVANLAVYVWLLKPWAKILAMWLSAGGHLTHWHPLNASGKFYQIIPYWVDKDWYIDYDQIEKLALEHEPDLILAGFSAYPRDINWSRFADIRNKLMHKTWKLSYLMGDISHIAWLVAWGKCGNPFEYFDIITTTTHKTLRWPRWAMIYYQKNNYDSMTLRWYIYKAWIKDTDIVAYVEHYSNIKNNSDFLKWNWNKWTKEFILDFINNNTIIKNYIYMLWLEKSINRGVFPWVQWWPFDHILYAKALALEEILDPNTHRSEYINNIIKNSQIIANYLSDKWRNIATWWTDNHIILVDVTNKNGKSTWFAGKQAEKALESIWLSTNKNSIPNDTRKPLDPSGMRIGTPAITSRWFGVDDCLELAKIIDNCLEGIWSDWLLGIDNKNILTDQVLKLCGKYPLWY